MSVTVSDKESDCEELLLKRIDEIERVQSLSKIGVEIIKEESSIKVGLVPGLE